MKTQKPKKVATFFGESGAKDEPFFMLAQALGVWGKPSPPPPPETVVSPKSPQGDLFDDMF
jgi:hypothetical protein